MCSVFILFFVLVILVKPRQMRLGSGKPRLSGEQAGRWSEELVGLKVAAQVVDFCAD